MAWTIEYDEGAVKDLNKLDRQILREILDFMEKRIAQAEDPRSRPKAVWPQQVRFMALSLARLSHPLPASIVVATRQCSIIYDE